MESDLLSEENDPLQIFIDGEDTDYEERDRTDDSELNYSDYDENKNESDYEDEDEFHDEPTELHSLQKLCLKTVIKNLDRFTSAYATSEDTSLRRNLLFLQRAYTELIIKEVKDDIKDSWLDFLLNEHLTEFTMSYFTSCNVDALLKRFEVIGHVFLKVYLNSFYNYKSFELEFMKKIMKLIPNVQTLHLPFSGEDVILTTIADCCPRLRELSIDNSTCSEAGVNSLFRVAEDGTVTPKCQLEVLSLRDAPVGMPALVYVLRHMPTLHTLSHNLVASALHSMHKDDFHTCGAQYRLTSLDLQHLDPMSGDLADVMRVCASVCPAITRLQTFVASQPQLDVLALFQAEELVLDGFYNSVGAEKVDLNGYLASNGGRLRELRLCDVSVSVKTLLESCKGLQSLYLRDVCLSGQPPSPVPTLPRMRKLVLEHFNFIPEEPLVEQSVAALLTACPKLEVLDLSRCSLGGLSTALKGFCERCTTLTELHFRLSDVRAGLVESILLTSPSLKMLLMHDCENIMLDNVDHFYEIVRARKDKIKIVWHGEGSEFNSMDDDFFDGDIFQDEYDSDDFHVAFDDDDYDAYFHNYDYDYDSESDY